MTENYFLQIELRNVEVVLAATETCIRIQLSDQCLALKLKSSIRNAPPTNWRALCNIFSFKYLRFTTVALLKVSFKMWVCCFSSKCIWNKAIKESMLRLVAGRGKTHSPEVLLCSKLKEFYYYNSLVRITRPWITFLNLEIKCSSPWRGNI